MNIAKLKKPINIFFLGVSSGIPISLILSTLKALLVDKGFDIKIIGFLSLVSLPYSLKILVAPILDSMGLPYLTKKLGNRRSWIIFSQIIIAILIIALGIAGENSSLTSIAILAFLLASFSAMQDIAIDGYRIEISGKDEQAQNSGFYIYGYRLGMLISGSLALGLSEIISWSWVYISMSGFIILCMINVLLAEESRKKWHPHNYNFTIWFVRFVIHPFKKITQKTKWQYILLFIIMFKLPDAFVGSLTLPFLLEIGFSKIELATILKTFGLVAILFGVYCGGILFKKIDVYKSLFIAIILQALSNFAFTLLTYFGHNSEILYLVVFIENFCGGLGDAMFVGYLSSLCNIKFTSTQYALLSSISSISRSLISSTSGFYASDLGWFNFFIFSGLLAIPAIALLFILTKKS